MKTITFLFAGALALLAVPARAALVWANSSYRQVITATGSVSGGSVANITVTYGAAERSFDGGNTWEPYNGAVFGGVAVQMWIGDGPNAGYYVGYSTISGTSGTASYNPQGFNATTIRFKVWGGGVGEDSPYGAVLWDSGAAAPPSYKYKTLSFSLTNSSDLWKWAGIFSQEQPGIMQLAARIGPGQSKSWAVTVQDTDTSHYYAAFVDAAASTGAEMVTQNLGEGQGDQVLYYQGVTPDASTATVAQTSQSSGAQGSNTLGSGTYVAAVPTGGGSPTITGNGQQTTGTADAATNAHVSSVGNSINKTITDVGAALQQTIKSTSGTDTAALNSINAAVQNLPVVATNTAAVASNVAAMKSSVDALKTSVDGLETAAQRDAKVAAAQNSANTDATSKAGAMNGQVQASMSQASGVASGLNSSGMLADAKGLAGALPVPADTGYADQAHVVASAGLLSDGIDTNPFTSPAVASVIGEGTLSAFAAWCRNALGWCICVGFLVYVAKEVKTTCHQIGNTQPMRLSAGTEIVLHTSALGNSIGVPAAGIMWGAQVIVISTLLLAAPVIIVAAFSTVSGAPDLIATAIANRTAAGSPGAVVSNALSYTNKFVPLTLVFTSLVNGILVQVGAITQWVIYAVGIKLIPI